MIQIKKIDFLLVLGAFMLLQSCVAERGAFKFYTKHPDLLAELCATKFPVENRLSPGKPEVQIRTVVGPGITLPCPEMLDPRTGSKITPVVTCPDTKNIYTNTLIRDTIYQENTAKLKVLEVKSAKEIADLQKLYAAELVKSSTATGNEAATVKSLKELKGSLLWHWLGHGVSIAGMSVLGFLFIRKTLWK